MNVEAAAPGHGEHRLAESLVEEGAHEEVGGAAREELEPGG